MPRFKESLANKAIDDKIVEIIAEISGTVRTEVFQILISIARIFYEHGQCRSMR